jgi:hypothetical protein
MTYQCFHYTARLSVPTFPSELTDAVKILDLDYLWQEVNYNFVHFDLKPVLDWEQTFRDFVPQILATKSDIEHVRALQAPAFTLIGEATAGSTGQPLVFELPSKLGWAAITAKRDELPDGKKFVGTGIQPDVSVRMTLNDFRKGRDPVLERALQHLSD